MHTDIRTEGRDGGAGEKMNGEEVMKGSGNKGTAEEKLRRRKEVRTTRVHKENNDWER